jgi:hypothetical protein
LKVAVASAEQELLLPGCSTSVMLVNAMLLSVLLVVPDCEVILYSQAEPNTVYFQSVPVSVTWSLELTDMLPGVTTDDVRAPRLDVHVCGLVLLPMVSPVKVSVAVPGDAGLALTDADRFEAVQVRVSKPLFHTKLVPDARPAVITSPTATSVPPTLPTVSTSDAAAGAGPIPANAASPVVRNETKVAYLRMPTPPEDLNTEMCADCQPVKHADGE